MRWKRRPNGNAYDRRARRRWLVEVHGVPRLSDGEKTRVRCYHCGALLRADSTTTWDVDRYPVCGHAGGSYRRDNIVVACVWCNRTRCNTKGKLCRQGPARRVRA